MRDRLQYLDGVAVANEDVYSAWRLFRGTLTPDFVQRKFAAFHTSLRSLQKVDLRNSKLTSLGRAILSDRYFPVLRILCLDQNLLRRGEIGPLGKLKTLKMNRMNLGELKRLAIQDSSATAGAQQSLVASGGGAGSTVTVANGGGSNSVSMSSSSNASTTSSSSNTTSGYKPLARSTSHAAKSQNVGGSSSSKHSILIHPLPGLQHLELSSNNIRSLTPLLELSRRVFPNLRVLVLAHNQISSLSPARWNMGDPRGQIILPGESGALESTDELQEFHASRNNFRGCLSKPGTASATFVNTAVSNALRASRPASSSSAVSCQGGSLLAGQFPIAQSGSSFGDSPALPFSGPGEHSPVISQLNVSGDGLCSRLGTAASTVRPRGLDEFVTSSIEAAKDYGAWLQQTGDAEKDRAPFRHLKKLKALVLNHNKIRHTDAYSFVGPEELQELHLTHNRIQMLDPFGSCIKLKVLRLDFNRVAALEAVPALVPRRKVGVQNKETLTSRRKRKVDIEEFLESEIHTISLARNPIARKPFYRFGLCQNLPRVLLIDGKRVTQEDRLGYSLKDNGKQHSNVLKLAATEIQRRENSKRGGGSYPDATSAGAAAGADAAVSTHFGGPLGGGIAGAELLTSSPLTKEQFLDLAMLAQGVTSAASLAMQETKGKLIQQVVEQRAEKMATASTSAHQQVASSSTGSGPATAFTPLPQPPTMISAGAGAAVSGGGPAALLADTERHTVIDGSPVRPQIDAHISRTFWRRAGRSAALCRSRFRAAPEKRWRSLSSDQNLLNASATPGSTSVLGNSSIASPKLKGGVVKTRKQGYASPPKLGSLSPHKRR
ncbi:unnamed protein product [Amoebophrya sp. A25]|nr:unnamed protein product [Amoebophrya sp. A25]|eukprot:GSA25T00023232001.1